LRIDASVGGAFPAGGNCSSARRAESSPSAIFLNYFYRNFERLSNISKAAAAAGRGKKANN
jgi:hypothetical protein